MCLLLTLLHCTQASPYTITQSPQSGAVHVACTASGLSLLLPAYHCSSKSVPGEQLLVKIMPHWMQAQQEVDEVLQGRPKPTMRDYTQLKYVMRCVNESMRLYPHPPVLLRRAMIQDELPGAPVSLLTLSLVTLLSTDSLSLLPLWLQCCSPVPAYFHSLAPLLLPCLCSISLWSHCCLLLCCLYSPSLCSHCCLLICCIRSL